MKKELIKIKLNYKFTQKIYLNMIIINFLCIYYLYDTRMIQMHTKNLHGYFFIKCKNV